MKTIKKSLLFCTFLVCVSQSQNSTFVRTMKPLKYYFHTLFVASNDTDGSRLMADLLPSPNAEDPLGGLDQLLSGLTPALLGEELE